MKREILFRGRVHASVSVWNKDGKRIKWVEGDLIQHRQDEWYIMRQNDSCWDVSHDGVRVDPSTVGQFTGRTTIEGKRIFEGDRINDVWTVVWSDFDNGWLCFHDEGDAESSLTDLMWGEVTGNIHDKTESK